MAWLVDLHVNLLSGKTGRLINGVGAVFVLALSITGAVLWWPGVRSWRRGLVIRSKSNWKLFNWQLHNVIGLWMLPFVFMFGVVGVYAGFPGPFQALVNKIAPLEVYKPIPEASLDSEHSCDSGEHSSSAAPALSSEIQHRRQNHPLVQLPAFRQFRRLAEQSDVGGHRAGAGISICHRRPDVVEPCSRPSRAPGI